MKIFVNVVLFYLIFVVAVWADDVNEKNVSETQENQETIQVDNKNINITSDKKGDDNKTTTEKSPIIEGIVSAGFIGFEPMFLDKSQASFSNVYMPYGKLHLRFDDNKFLRPEFIIEETGSFSFKKSGITNGKSHWAYNKYYLKIPTGIPVPFFKFTGRLYLDGLYSTSNINILLKKPSVVNNTLYNKGEKFTGISSEMTFRLYLDTPIVMDNSIFEYSYFGVFYSERVSPRSASPPGNIENPQELILSALVRTGGIFYELKKDTPLKGLNFNILGYIGYGDMFNLDDVSAVNNVKFGNTTGLLTFYFTGGFSYRYIFNTGVGIEVNAGASVFTTSEFLHTKDDSKYSMNMGVDLRYFANLSFVFGY